MGTMGPRLVAFGVGIVVAAADNFGDDIVRHGGR